MHILACVRMKQVLLCRTMPVERDNREKLYVEPNQGQPVPLTTAALGGWSWTMMFAVIHSVLHTTHNFIMSLGAS